MSHNHDAVVQTVNHASAIAGILAFLEYIPWASIAAMCATIWWLSRFVIFCYKLYKKKKEKK
jgi:hypothetical protein